MSQPENAELDEFISRMKLLGFPWSYLTHIERSILIEQTMNSVRGE